MGIAAGVHDLEVGARLRYEIVREFAPCVGSVWQRSLGDTAALLRAAGARYRDGSLVFGIRAWHQFGFLEMKDDHESCDSVGARRRVVDVPLSHGYACGLPG
ncbi:MAG: copper resistance protein B, partial [Longimicrobiales bacterium]